MKEKYFPDLNDDTIFVIPYEPYYPDPENLVKVTLKELVLANIHNLCYPSYEVILTEHLKDSWLKITWNSLVFSLATKHRMITRIQYPIDLTQDDFVDIIMRLDYFRGFRTFLMRVNLVSLSARQTVATNFLRVCSDAAYEVLPTGFSHADYQEGWTTQLYPSFLGPEQPLSIYKNDGHDCFPPEVQEAIYHLQDFAS